MNCISLYNYHYRGGDRNDAAKQYQCIFHEYKPFLNEEHLFRKRCSHFDLFSFEPKSFRSFQFFNVKDEIFTVVVDIIINPGELDGFLGTGFLAETAKYTFKFIYDEFFRIPCLALFLIGDNFDAQRRADPGAQAARHAL